MQDTTGDRGDAAGSTEQQDPAKQSYWQPAAEGTVPASPVGTTIPTAVGPPSPPPPVTPVDFTFGGSTPLQPATGAKAGNGRHRLLGVVGAVAVLGAGAAVSVSLAAGGTSAANSPGEAVTNLLSSAQHSDVLGMLDSLDPAERDALKSGITSLVGQLQRLDVLSSSTNLSNVSGLYVQFHDVTTRADMLRPDLADVFITGGTATAQVNAAQLPLGGFTRSVAGDALGPTHQLSTTSGISSGQSPIVTVKEGDNWYVSLGYTIAENARRALGASMPSAGQAVPAVGSSSPEAAVRGFLDSVAAFDVTGMIRATPPEELAALHQYAPLFVSGAQSALDQAKAHASVTIDSLDLAAVPQSDGSQLVQIKRLGFTVVVDGRLTVQVAGGCAHITDSSDPTADQTVCPDQSSNFAGLPPDIQQLLQRVRDAHPAEGIVAVQEGGQWYVDPVRTVFTDVDDLLATLGPNDLTAIRNAIGQFSLGLPSSG